MFCGKSEYNVHNNITRRIKCIIEIFEGNDLNVYKKGTNLLLLYLNVFLVGYCTCDAKVERIFIFCLSIIGSERVRIKNE